MAAKKRKSNRNNRAGKICISMILVVFAAAMSVQIVKAYQKDQEYARKQEQLEAVSYTHLTLPTICSV